MITFLRDPRAHVYSQWLHCYQNKNQFFNPINMPGNLTGWLQHWVSNGDQPNPNATWANIFHCYHPANLQSRYLSCRNWRTLPCVSPAMDGYVVTDTEGAFVEDFERAKQHVEAMHFVCLTEFYQESMCVLHMKMKNEFPEYCNCENVEAWKTFPMTHITHGGQHGTVYTDVDKSDIALIDRLTLDDSKLHAIARRRLLHDISEAERIWNKRIFCKGDIRSANKENTIELYPWDYEPGSDAEGDRTRGACNKKEGTQGLH